MSDIIIYGAGNKGKAYLSLLDDLGLGNKVKYYCDKKADFVSKVQGIPVINYKEAKSKNLPFVVAIRKENQNDVVRLLLNDGMFVYRDLDSLVVDELKILSRTDYERRICKAAHEDAMEDYYESSDTEEGLAFFWKDGECKGLFDQLDLSNVVELACGRGRHVPLYAEKSEHVTLVDILDKNIEFCKQRFSGYGNISYLVNNGRDLSALKSDAYSALFTYDSMVHFELMDIASYLDETYRILEPGGMALFHHSNNNSDYKASYDNAIEARSFMSKNLFAYLAYRSGFEVLEQHVVDWVVPDLDCLTLVMKPRGKNGNESFLL